MISEKQFLTLPACEKCKNKGKYNIRCNSEEQQEEHGTAAGEIVTIICSACRANRRRREMFLENENFEPALRFYELDDYDLPDEGQTIPYKKTLTSLQLAHDLINDFEGSLIKPGGFIMVYGGGRTGKSILSHIFARESYLQGYSCDIVSLSELIVTLSNRIQGGVIKVDDQVVFDIDDFVNLSLLIIDDFSLVNDYFDRADIRRGVILNILKRRSKAGKPTIINSQLTLKELFAKPIVDAKKLPYDFPTIIDKNFKALHLHGKFKNKIPLGNS